MTKSFERRLLTCAGIMYAAGCMLGMPRAYGQDQSRAELITNGSMGGLHYGVPLKWSVALGYILPGGYNGWQPFVNAEPGIGGWRAGIGALKMTNELGGGLIARGSVLRTAKRAWRAPSQVTYVGPEFQFMPIFAIGARVGGFTRVGGKGARGLFTGDLSVMF